MSYLGALRLCGADAATTARSGAAAAVTSASPTANLTPARLAALDRPLTPDEQARVNAWQTSPDYGRDIPVPTGPAPHGNYAGPQTVLPTEVVTARIAGRPWWQAALVGLVVAVAGYGLWRVAR